MDSRLSDLLENYHAPLRVYLIEGTNDTLYAVQEGAPFSMAITDSTTRADVEEFVSFHVRPVLPLVTDRTFHTFTAAPNRTTMIIVADAANAENGFPAFVAALKKTLLEGMQEEEAPMSVYAKNYSFVVIDGATDVASLSDADVVPVEMPVMLAYRVTDEGATFYPLPLAHVKVETSLPHVLEWLEKMNRPLVPLDKQKRREWRARKNEEYLEALNAEAAKNGSTVHDEL